MKEIKQPNFVAKHMLKFNKAHVEVDRKKELKRGKEKNKKWSHEDH